MGMGAIYPHMLLILLLLHGANAASRPPVQKWQTLDGRPPLVIARGGFSGLFPDSSQLAYQFALVSSLPDVVLYCDLQLSSDGVAFCKTGLTLENSTLIHEAFPNRAKTYKFYGEDLNGWFAFDFKSQELSQDVKLLQNLFVRPSTFDGSMGMCMLDDVVGLQPPQIWVNVEYDSFFQEHKLSSKNVLLALPKDSPVTYISSPEISFLKSLSGKLKSKTKLILRILKEDAIEPSTKISYTELLKDLKSIKAFASGILVNKIRISPVNRAMYVEPSTSLVKDAHAVGLEVFAYGFANDILYGYNYSYEPHSEYLQFIDNSDFSVDGLLTDFPPTASGAVACLAHTKGNALPSPGIADRPLIITHNGASGVFPGSTDLAYQQAVKDGSDIIDCSVQMSKDGVAFCMGSADLSGSTTAAATLMTKVTTVKEIQNKSGIFSFDLSWSEIQTLKPQIYSPYAGVGLKRNPAVKNAGKFMTLAEFLDFVKTSNVSGMLIRLQSAPYLATRGLGMVDAVSSALVKASYDKETKQQVHIQSDDSSVLSAFKKFPAFKRVLEIDPVISDVSKPAVDKIKEFADAVWITRASLSRSTGSFMVEFTNVINTLHDANISVYIGMIKNEFMNLAFDFWADPMVEISTYLSLGLDGLVTEFPGTASAYFKSPCSDLNLNLTYTILPANAGALVNLTIPGSLPPVDPPAPVLEPADVLDPPLPPVSVNTPPAPAPKAADQSTSAANSRARNYLLVAGIAAFLCLSFH